MFGVEYRDFKMRKRRQNFRRCSCIGESSLHELAKICLFHTSRMPLGIKVTYMLKTVNRKNLPKVTKGQTDMQVFEDSINSLLSFTFVVDI